jgi:predicted RNase H-like HicB family nuclease
VNHGVGLEQARQNLRELIHLGFADEITWFEPQTEPMFPPETFDVARE